MKPSDINWSLLARYATGDASAAERRAVETWRDASPENDKMLAELMTRWHTIQPSHTTNRSEEMWQAVCAAAGIALGQASADASTSAETARQSPRRASPPGITLPVSRERRLSRTWFAASVLSAAAAIVFAVVVTEHVASLRSRNGAQVTTQTYRTGVGEKATITIADHRVTLAPHSTLVVEGSNAYLTGEALFEHSAGTPSSLVVHARNARIREVGTVFDVRAYADDPDVRIEVEQGNVMVGTSDSGHTLLLGVQDVGHVEVNGAVSTTIASATASADAWTRGTLVFERTPLRLAANQLARWYGVDFVIPDSADGRIQITMTFRTADSIESVIHALALITGKHANRTGNVVTITSARHSP